MRKRLWLVPVLLLTLALGLAQDVPPQLNVDVRLSIVESRLGRLELDVAGLTRMPEALARIETKLEAISEKSSDNSNVLQSVGMSIVTLVIGGAIGDLIGRRRQK